MKPVFGVINHHDRARFEVHLIALGPEPTPEAGYRDHSDDVLWPARQLANGPLAEHIAAAGIDVLIDLNGYSAQRGWASFFTGQRRCNSAGSTCSPRPACRCSTASLETTR